MPHLSFRVLPTIAMVAIATAVLGGCTSEQAYSGGQAWQRNECNRLPDGMERTRCLERANTSYDDYQKEVEAAKARK